MPWQVARAFVVVIYRRDVFAIPVTNRGYKERMGHYYSLTIFIILSIIILTTDIIIYGGKYNEDNKGRF